MFAENVVPADRPPEVTIRGMRSGKTAKPQRVCQYEGVIYQHSQIFTVKHTKSNAQHPNKCVVCICLVSSILVSLFFKGTHRAGHMLLTMMLETPWWSP